MNLRLLKKIRLLIITHVVHYQFGGEIYAYGAYAREIELWADLFREVAIAAPCRAESPPGDCLAFQHANISIIPQLETGGRTLGAKMKQVLLLPRMIINLLSAARKADAIHVRCPGNLGLLGVLIAPLCSRRLIAKYAGQWGGYPGEPSSVRLQRWLLRSSWWHGPVTVYGSWPDQPSHVVPFFTSMLTDAQVFRAMSVAFMRNGKPIDHLLYVGRLSNSKHVDTFLEAIARMRDEGISFRCSVVGEGAARAELETQARELGIEQNVNFAGGVNFEQVQNFYAQSDVLVLVSETEGWPKALAEGMAYGLICIGSNRGLVPAMLSNGRGIVVEPGNAEQLADALREIVRSPQDFQPMRLRAAAWASQHSTEGLREALGELLTDHWICRPTPQDRPFKPARGAYT